tara:strand:- start:338 stop:853 length:516 start_codon:yes stop_codon:yes gene_type:complete
MKTLLFIKIIFLLFLFNTKNFAEEKLESFNEHEISFYSGMFDFSDHGAKSTLFGIEHQNENLVKDSFVGTISPVTGLMFTADNATYIYTGIQAQYNLGKLNIVPSFTPGLYGEGNGKDLGHIVEFKSEVQLSLNIFEKSQLGFSYNHISNASLGDKNPGANSYMFNFLKKF